MQAMLLGPWVSIIAGKKMSMMGFAHTKQKDLVYLGELLEGGKIVPVIDRDYPLNDVTEAMRYLVEGHAKGKVVVRINGRTGDFHD